MVKFLCDDCFVYYVFFLGFFSRSTTLLAPVCDKEIEFWYMEVTALRGGIMLKYLIKWTVSNRVNGT